MQHLIDLTLADYCGRLVLLVFLLLDAGTTIYALHHQPANTGFKEVEGNPLVGLFVKLLGVDGAMIVTKAIGVAMTYYFVPIWPVFLFGGAAVLAFMVVNNVRVIRAGAAVALVLGLILLIPPPALAGTLVASQGDDSVRLTDAACTNEAVRARLLPDSVDEWRAATAVFQGQHFDACWRMVGNSAYLKYEDGDSGQIPAADLKPALDI